MKTIKNWVKQGNDLLCGEDALLGNICRDATRGTDGKSFITLIGFALFIQYILPVIIILMIIPFVIGNIIAGGVIGLIAMSNPIYLFLFIPLGVVDLTLIIIVLVAWGLAMIIYAYTLFKSIGWLSFVPIIMMFVAAFFGMIPYIGDIIAGAISLFPWMAVMIAAYYFVYK